MKFYSCFKCRIIEHLHILGVISKRMSSHDESFCPKKLDVSQLRSHEIFRSSYSIDIWHAISLQICEIFRSRQWWRANISRSARIFQDHFPIRGWKIRITCENHENEALKYWYLKIIHIHTVTWQKKQNLVLIVQSYCISIFTEK